MTDTTITWLRGEKKLEPIEYRLTKRFKARSFKFLRAKVEYCIETNYMTLAPFKSKRDAWETALAGGIRLIDCTGEE